MRAAHHSLDVLYSADGLPQDIRDLQTTTAIINIPETFNVEDIDVGLTLQHTWVRDLTIWLERDSIFIDTVFVRRDTVWDDSVNFHFDTTWAYVPDTTFATVLLLDLFPGDSVVNMTDFWFDDDAGRGVYEALPPLTGGYRPLRSLDSMFVGHNAIGQWRLKVRDRYLFDEGVLQNFWIEINGVASLTGVITGSTCGLPISGASVVVQDTVTSDTVGNTVTNGAGEYSVNRVATGDYRVTVKAAGYDSLVVSPVAIVQNQHTQLDAVLISTAGTCDVSYSGAAVPIADLARIEVPLTVTPTGRIQDIDVTINCLSTWIAELAFVLEHPGGDSITLFKFESPLPDLGDNMVNCRFDDEAEISFADTAAPFTGTFKPLDSLSRFDNLQAAGVWHLNVEDFGAGDTGTLQGFTLHLALPLDGEENAPFIPESFKLHPAYPNPFNPSTSIALDVTRTQDIKLQVFDITGRLVETLFSGKLNAGSHHFIWSPLTAASGMYFVRAYSTDLSQTMKIVLLK